MTRSWWIAAAALLVAAPLLAAPKPVPLGTFMEWDALADGRTKTYSTGGLTLQFRAKKKPARREQFEESATDFVFSLSTSDGNKIVRSFSGGFDYPRATFAVGKLDPSSVMPQVILEVYSGGAHCCQARTVFIFDRSGWKLYPIQAGLNSDPDEEFPKDINADGVPDIVLFDDRFAYVFGCFACSWMPPQVFNVRDGRVVDVSGSRRFDVVFRDDLAKAKAACTGKNGVRGYCSGVAADGARLGQFESAWRWTLAHDPKDDWQLPQDCKVALRRGECPKGSEIIYATWPEALAAFLRRNGYITPAQQRWAVTESRHKVK